MIPLDKGDSFSKYVARSIEVVKESGLPYQLTPMGTCVEGEWDEVFDVIKRCFEEQQKDSGRVSVSIKADYRKGKSGRLKSKIESVKRIVGEIRS